MGDSEPGFKFGFAGAAGGKVDAPPAALLADLANRTLPGGAAGKAPAGGAVGGRKQRFQFGGAPPPAAASGPAARGRVDMSWIDGAAASVELKVAAASEAEAGGGASLGRVCP